MHLFPDFSPEILLLIRGKQTETSYTDPLVAACQRAYPHLPTFELDGQSDAVSWHYAHALLDQGVPAWAVVVWESDDWQPLAGLFRKFSKQPERFRVWVTEALPSPLKRLAAQTHNTCQHWPHEQAMMQALA